MIVVTAMVIVMLRSSPMVAFLPIGRNTRLRPASSFGGHTTLDNLVELPAIEPNSSAL